MDSRQLQSQRNGIEDNDDMKLSLANIKKIQTNAKFRTLTIDKTALSTKATVNKKGVDISIKK